MTDAENQRLQLKLAIYNDILALGFQGVSPLHEHIHTLTVEVQTRQEFKASIRYELQEIGQAHAASEAQANEWLRQEAHKRLQQNWLQALLDNESDYCDNRGVFAQFHADFRVDCQACGAQAGARCNACSGRGSFICPQGACHNGFVRCGCYGQGGVCSNCQGSGQFWVNDSRPGGDSRRLENCNWCHGSGRHGVCLHCLDAGGQACRACSGRGQMACPSCRGHGTHVCSACAGQGERHFRRIGTFIIEREEFNSGDPDSGFDQLIKVLPHWLDQPAAQILHGRRSGQNGTTGWIEGTRHVPVAAAFFPDQIADVVLGHVQQPPFRTDVYLNRATAHLVEAMQGTDDLQLQLSELGRELLARSNGDINATEIMDRYGLRAELEPLAVAFGHRRRAMAR